MIIALLSVSASLAGEPEFADVTTLAETEEKTPDAPETHLSAEAGGANASGNTDFFNVNGVIKADHKWSKDKVSGFGLLNIGKSVVDVNADGLLDIPERAAGRQEVARRYQLEARYDRYLGETTSFYGLAGVLADRFAGYDMWAHEQLGVSQIAYDQDDTKLVVELGADLAQQNFVEGVEPNTALVPSVRVFAGVITKVNEDVAFSQDVEVLENVLEVSDLRLRSVTAITARLSDVLSLKVSETFAFDNEPVAGYLPSDSTTLVTFVATLM